MLFYFVLIGLLLIASAGAASAEPITAALFGAAFASTFLGSVVTFAVTTAISVGASLLIGALTAKDQQASGTQAPAGIQFEVQMGDDVPASFTVGSTATAGTRRYIGTWGAEGQTPNAYLTDVIQVGDLPAPGTPGVWINGQHCSIDWNAPVDQGYPVLEFRVDGKDHVWVQYVDGTIGFSNPFLRDRFGGHAERPWKESMIGFGCPYLIVTALFNRDLFTGGMSYLVEVPPTPWYDIRKDSSMGGSGAHRWNDQSTWEPTLNPVVISYNIIRGVYFGDEWFYGGQDLAPFRLPASSVMAAANECDAPRALAEGGTEPQFRCGMEIRVDMEPLAVAAELMKSCAGRVAEVGGIFKFQVGAPGSAVYGFTDADILVTQGQSLSPFPTLDETHNGIEATYPEPLEMWKSKDAPARYSDELEASDGDRRLASGIHFTAVPYPVQVQQLMRTFIEDARRFRRHAFHLPPDAYPLEPNDVVAWSSDRNGYINKKFLVDNIVGKRTTNQLVLLKEVDPNDYSWSSDFERPYSVGHLAIIRPTIQLMTGWQVLPASFDDADGRRRPSIEVRFDGFQEDVSAVQVQVRNEFDQEIVFDGELPYGQPAAGAKSVVLNGVFLHDHDYEVRGKFVPYTGRSTDWSSWLAVTTFDIRQGLKDFEDWVRAQVTTLQEQFRDEIQELKAGLNIAANQDARNWKDKKVIRREFNSRTDEAFAQVQEAITIATNTQMAFASYETTVSASFGSLTAFVSTTAAAVASVNLMGARYAITLDVNGFASGFELLNGGGGFSAAIFYTTSFQIVNPGYSPKAVFTVGTINGVPATGIAGNVYLDGTLNARAIEAGTINALQISINGVDILNLIPGSATKIESNTVSSVTLSVFGAEYTLCSVSFSVPDACAALISGSMNLRSTVTGFVIGSVTYTSASEEWTKVRIYVDGTLVQEDTYDSMAFMNAGPSSSVQVRLPRTGAVPIMKPVVLATGSHTIEVRAVAQAYAGLGFAGGPTFDAGGFAVFQSRR